MPPSSYEVKPRSEGEKAPRGVDRSPRIRHGSVPWASMYEAQYLNDPHCGIWRPIAPGP